MNAPFLQCVRVDLAELADLHDQRRVDAFVRDADPRSAANSRLAALWRRLLTAVADRLGPPTARGLG